MEYQSSAVRTVTGPTIRPGGLFLTDRALAFCDFPPGAQLLDVGCGIGATVEHLRECHRLDAVGIDPSCSMLEEGRARNPELPLGLGSAERIPAADGSKDGILCECVLSLLPDPALVLAEFRRVLRPDGFLILSDMYDRQAEGRGRFQLRLTDAGFTLLLFEDHTPLLKELAARLVLAHGSLDGLGCRGCGGRPGYYLLVAQKDSPRPPLN